MPDTCSGVRQCGTGKSTDNLNRENKMNEKSFPKQECGGELFFLSQEIASCERKSLRHRKLRPVKAGKGAVYRRISLYLYWDTDI